MMNAKDYLQDIAGVRVICYFVDDIYNLTELLKSQSDLIVIKERDYIGNPKPNGYRSYHVIVGVPVYCLDGMEYFPVEIQFRTMSMDFWASMEHRISYKKERTDKEQLKEELREYANMLVEIESRFEQYNETDHQQEKRNSRSKTVTVKGGWFLCLVIFLEWNVSITLVYSTFILFSDSTFRKYIKVTIQQFIILLRYYGNPLK